MHRRLLETVDFSISFSPYLHAMFHHLVPETVHPVEPGSVLEDAQFGSALIITL